MKKDVLKSSFVIGSVALVFLIVGYQTALFIHSAAMAKIAADRDCPDTVYVALETGRDFASEDRKAFGNPGGGKGWEDAGWVVREAHRPAAGTASDAATGTTTGTATGAATGTASGAATGTATGTTSGTVTGIKGMGAKVIGRKSGAKNEIGKKVRENQPRRKVESFSFDPNTADIEELQRLGFSLKQAQSIDNYRKKGGRFRRKSDFAKSFVVSDSVFRRLEPYIEIPKLDLNLADSAAFDALPGIGGWFARQMIEYRKRLGGYSFPEQLTEIRNFDREKFDRLSDLIFVSARTAVPYPLWTLPEEELKRHPYIGQAAHGIVLFRSTQPKEMWSVEELLRNGILPPEDAQRLGRCLIAAP